MKRILILIPLLFLTMNVFSDELMANLRDASDQVSQDTAAIVGGEILYSGAISYDNKPVVMGDLFSDLLANRLLGNSRFRGEIIKGYAPGTSRVSDAQWMLSGSLYKTGASFFLSLYLTDNQGRQKKGWEFLLPVQGADSLLGPSKMAVAEGGDIYEPNDSSDTAVLLTPDPMVSIDDLRIGDGNDEDWFYVDVEEIGSGTDMFLLNAYTTGGLDTYIELFSPEDSSYPIAENDDGNDSNANISYALSETGRWYIKVRGYSSDETGDYGLTVSLESREAGPGEPDNSISEASYLEVEGDDIRRVMDFGEDYDYFRIELDRDLPSDKAIVIETYSDLDLTMTLLDEYENEVMTNDDSGNGSNPRIMIPALERGSWFPVVYPYDGDNTGQYRIRAYIMDVVKDDYEDDNTMDEAKVFEINGPEQRRTFMPANEEDWVKFVVERRGEFIIKTSGPIDTQMTLYDRYGEYIYEDDDSGNDNNALISETLEEGVYYLQITQYESDGNIEDEYILSIKQF